MRLANEVERIGWAVAAAMGAGAVYHATQVVAGAVIAVINGGQPW